MAVEIIPPFKVYPDRDGSPLEAGYIYVGEPNQDPQSSPIAVFWDAALTQPASQPIRTLNGVASRNGSPSAFFAGGDYSIRVNDKRNVTLYSSPSRQVSGLGDIVLEAGDRLILRAGATQTVSDGASIILGTDDGGPARLIFNDNARTTGDILPFNDNMDRIGRADLRYEQAFVREVFADTLALNADNALPGASLSNTVVGGTFRIRQILPKGTLGFIGDNTAPFASSTIKEMVANDISVLRTTQPGNNADLVKLNARAMNVAVARIAISGGVGTVSAQSLNVGAVNVNGGTGAVQVTIPQAVHPESALTWSAWKTGTPLIVNARLTSGTQVDFVFTDRLGAAQIPDFLAFVVTGPGSAAGAGSITPLS